MGTLASVCFKFVMLLVLTFQKTRAGALEHTTTVATSVLVFGSPNYVINTFQDKRYKSGFFGLRPTHANDRSVTLSTPAQASKFRAGDYVAIYSEDPTNKDVIPGERSQVTSVSQAGVLGLKHPLARAFPSPVIARVTSLATVNVSVSDLIVQGTEPLNINEVFGFTASGNTFISDTSIGGGNIYGLIMNALRGVHFDHNRITSLGPLYVSQELPQRNSQDVVIASNVFDVGTLGFGEYGSHWIITGNEILVPPEQLTSGAALSFGGYDVLFSHNQVQGCTTALPLMAGGLDWRNSLPT
jgi:hypothetical protein